jgi:TonB-dependent receptor-like protein
VAKNVLGYVSLPNLPQDPAQPTGGSNYVPGIPTEDTIDSAVSRLDHQFSERHKVFATLRWNHWEESIGNVFGNLATGTLATRINRGAGLDDVYVFNPATVLNLRYGLARWESPTVSSGIGFNPTQLGFGQAFVSRLPAIAFPQFSIAGGLGATPSDYTITNNHAWTAALTRVQGRQTFNIGAQFMVLQTASFNTGAGAGSYSFSPQFTQRDFQTADRLSGSDVASFLLGYPSGGSVSVNDSAFYSQHYFGLYVQDDWRVSPRLTLSLGLRWDVEIPYRERFLRANRGFDTTTANPVQAAAQAAYAKNPIPEIPVGAFGVAGGQLFAGGSEPDRNFDTDYRAWQPRFGLAYRVDSKTAIRAGFGLFTSKTTATGGQLGYSINTPLVNTTDGGRTPAVTLTDPFPQGILQPFGKSQGLLTNLGQAPRWDDPTRNLPYSVQSSFQIQRELKGSWLVAAGYAYNRSKRLPINVPSNQMPLATYLDLGKPRYDSAGRLLAQPFRLEDRVANPFFGLPQFVGTALGTGSTVAVSQLLQAFPEFTAFNRGQVDAGLSSYHGLQMKLEKRFSESLALIVSHTWSKQLDNVSYLNPIAYQVEHSLNADDRTHYFSAGWSWELPFGRGRRLWSGASRVTNAVVGGWQVSGIYTLQSGRPIIFGTNLTWNGEDASIARGSRTLDRWFQTADFGIIAKENTYALRATPTTFGTIRASRQNNADMAVFKNFRPKEHLTLQFRFESCNTFNHPRFGDPNTNPANAAFGTVAKSALNQPRILQLALKVNF